MVLRVLPFSFAETIAWCISRVSAITSDNFTEEKIHFCHPTPHSQPRELNALIRQILYSLTGLSDAVVLKWLPWMTSADNRPVAEL